MIKCYRCHGVGTIVNPNIDGNGITASEMTARVTENPEFINNYLTGVYDITCPTCKGSRMLDMSPRAVEERLAREEFEAEERAERRALGY